MMYVEIKTPKQYDKESMDVGYFENSFIEETEKHNCNYFLICSMHNILRQRGYSEHNLAEYIAYNLNKRKIDVGTTPYEVKIKLRQLAEKQKNG